jgi:hypothetical protein
LSKTNGTKIPLFEKGRPGEFLVGVLKSPSIPLLKEELLKASLKLMK